LLKYETCILDFSFSMLLLQLQWDLNLWIAEPWFDAPREYAEGFCKDVAAKYPDTFVAVGAQSARIEYDAARKALEAALACDGMTGMTRHLVSALDKFWRAYWIRSKLTKLAEATRFSFTEQIAEESWVCTLSGLSYGALFFAWEPERVPLDLITDSKRRNVDMEAAAREWGSSHIHPYFTRSFSEVLAAQALTLSRSAREFSDGIARLEQLRTKFAGVAETDMEFELGWIDLALLKAHKHAHNERAALECAKRIAMRTVLRATRLFQHP
jgi:hypothetical protein